MYRWVLTHVPALEELRISAEATGTKSEKQLVGNMLGSAYYWCSGDDKVGGCLRCKP